VAKKKGNINYGLRNYQKVLREFSKINAKLPEENQLSIEERRKYIKDEIFPQFKGDKRVVGVKRIKDAVLKVYDIVLPKEASDINYIPQSAISDFAWFDVDEFIKEVLPQNIDIMLDAGKLGATKIFNTSRYDYTRSGVKKIYEAIRDKTDNKSGGFFTGVKKLKKGKKNDGNPKNYYIQFILVLDLNPVKKIEPVAYKLPKSEKKKANSVKNTILNRVKLLGNKKKRRKNARKNANKNIKEIKKIKKRQDKAKSLEYKRKLDLEKIDKYLKTLKQLQNALNKGNITQEQYDKYEREISQIITDIKKKGGII
jgi:hypothetical protein